MVLHHQRNPDTRCNGAVVLEHAIIIGHRLGLRRYHYRIRTQRLGHLTQAQRGTGATVAGDYDDRHAPGCLHPGADQLLALAVEHAVGFTQHAQDGDPVHAEHGHEADQAVEGFKIEGLVVMKGRRENRVHACERNRFGHRHRRLLGSPRFSRRMRGK
jgi:hypothetical protein